LGVKCGLDHPFRRSDQCIVELTVSEQTTSVDGPFWKSLDPNSQISYSDDQAFHMNRGGLKWDA
jgi:hypothetical protein